MLASEVTQNIEENNPFQMMILKVALWKISKNSENWKEDD